MVVATPSAWAHWARATRWFWWLCTPPSETRPMRWSRPPEAFSSASRAPMAGLSRKVPLRMAASMRVSSCHTTRPAPRFMCPTSELPNWPSGRPTPSPPAWSWVAA